MREKGQSFCRSIRKCRRSQKSQSLRDRQRNHLKNARDCEEEMQMLNKEMEESKALYETRFRALSEKSGHCRKAAAELENQIQTLQVGEERRGCSASQSNGCCFDPATGEQVFAFGETRAASFIQFIQQEFVRQCRTPDPKETGMMRSKVGGMKALRWILL